MNSYNYIANIWQTFLNPILGPILPRFLKRFGCRVMAMASMFIMSLGFILSSYTPNVAFLFLSHGLLGGKNTISLSPPLQIAL